MTLTVRQVETAKPRNKAYKLPDGNGLVLLLKTTGAGGLHLAGMKKLLAVGVYPQASLATARQRCAVPPMVPIRSVKQAARQARNSSGAVTFKDIAVEWLS